MTSSFKQGQTVAVLRIYYDGRSTAGLDLVVERILKTQIVLSDGSRWRPDGRERGPRHAWTAWEKVLDVHDPRIVAARRSAEVGKLRRLVGKEATECDDVGRLRGALAALRKGES